MRAFAIFILIAAFAPWTLGQRASFGAHAAAPAPSRSGGPHLAHGGSFAFGHGAYRASRFDRYGAAYTSLPFPFFADAFDSDDIYSTGYPVASAPPPFLIPPMARMGGRGQDSIAADMNSSAGRSSQPLMIELQNGHYVHVNDAAIDGEAVPLASAAQVTKSEASRIATSPADSAPAVLIFRDGHNEEVRDYTIADGALYARGDFYVDGYWNKKIQISSLNVPQTLEANAQRGVKFVLPSSPNEVVTRP
jgi:hypothetical protein